MDGSPTAATCHAAAVGSRRALRPRRAAAEVWMTRRRLLLALAALLAPAQLPGARAEVKLAYKHTSKTGGLYK